MPNWKIHIEIGKRINTKLKYNDEDFNLFLLGNILPDINNCYVVTNISKKISHDITHFKSENEISYKNFYNKYKNIIKRENPLIMGYLIHLYVDYKWNENFYSNVKLKKILEKDYNQLRIIKQNDFKIYNNKFVNNIINLNNFSNILDQVNVIEEISVTEDDIIEIVRFLKLMKIYNSKLEFYKIEELDNLMEDTINQLVKIL